MLTAGRVNLQPVTTGNEGMIEMFLQQTIYNTRGDIKIGQFQLDSHLRFDTELEGWYYIVNGQGLKVKQLGYNVM